MFQILVKLDSSSGDETSYIDVKVTVTFEETKNLFYPPEPVNVYTKNGTFKIEATEEVHITIAFSAVLNIEDYPIKILEVMDGLIDKEGASCPEMPIFVLLIAYDDELDMFEAFPVSITVKFYPNEKKKSDSTQAQRVLQFNNFIDKITKGEVLLEEKKVRKDDRT